MNNDKLYLYEHNKESYEKVQEAFEKDNVVGIVHATGTGKSYNALQLLLDNKDKKTMYLVPSNGIIEHIKKIIEENNLSLEKDFPNVEFRTYQSLINLSRDEIKELDIDMLVLDEFHHIGAPVWGERVKEIIETHEDLKVFGMTAYTVRDRKTPYERDMAKVGGNELFSDKIVSRYDLSDAMVDGVLPKPIYKSAYINLLGMEQELEEKVLSDVANKKEQEEYMKILKDVKRKIVNAPGVKELVRKNIKPNGKYIYFCPPCSKENENDIKAIEEEIRNYLKEYVNEEDIVFYETTSEMKDAGRKNREAFYDDKTLEGIDVSNKLRVMFAINQYNEGVHAPNIDGVIMGRSTSSDIVYFEQLGRALAVRGKNLESIEELEQYSVKELKIMCDERDIKYDKNISKEELIEKLVAPIIIDLVNNFDYIKELEDNLKDKIKERQQNKGKGKKRDIKIKDYSFDIEIENRDLYEMLRYIKDRTTRSWDKMYEYACIYYGKHDDLEVPTKFKTNNGKDYDENGKINLGTWIATQRQKVSPESERGRLLSQIGMRFEVKDNEQQWHVMYKYACIYYGKHGDLEVSVKFKTNNGKDYDENGSINLGKWISRQRQKVSPESERGRLLSQIGMRFKNKRKRLSFEEMYKYAKAYYEVHGDLEVSQSFKTNNGKDYDKNGTINLGTWIATQRLILSSESERGRLLSQIGMRFKNKNSTLNFEEMYKYACIYYGKHGDLEVPTKFKTNNGKDYDENGTINLGTWISTQRRTVSPESERGRLLSQISMRFEVKDSEQQWHVMYEYACIYYGKYGNLEVPQKFKTNNGSDYDENGSINLGRWITTQRRKVSSESERGILLSQIGMRFEKKIKRLGFEEMYKYAKAYYEVHGDLEVSQRFKTNNGSDYDKNGTINLGHWISTQRQKESSESERGRLLSQIGMRFENKIKRLGFEEMYEYAKAYYEVHGDLEVPTKFKTNNGSDYEKNGTINLGTWIVTQRQKVLPKSERGRLLSQIGMRFGNKIKRLGFEEMYKYAKAYYEVHGDLEISQRFKTNNGKDYDENGIINLGTWIVTQRRFVSPESERGRLLSKIGMRFETKGKNRDLATNICNENNININLNKNIVNRIPYQEFISKVEYLKENNIHLVEENGKLHEIFSMSSPNMKEKYNITLEELINSYYIKEKEKGK